MKCTNCHQLLKQTNKFCANCGSPNIDYKENLIDKHIDRTIDKVQKLNKVVVNELAESEHISTFVDTSKSKLREFNESLSNIFLFVGIITIIYSFIYDTPLYTNLFEYTKPSESYGDPGTHMAYLLLYVSFLLLIPIGFIIIKFSKNPKIKSFIIPLIILYIIFLFSNFLT